MTEPTSHSNDAPSRKSLVERLQVFVGIVLAVVAGYSAWQLNSAEKSLKESERTLKTRDSATPVASHGPTTRSY